MKLSPIILCTFFTIYQLLGSSKLIGTDKIENWPSGNVKKSFSVDAENKKNGIYEEFFANGQLKIKSFYKKNLLEGSYTEYLEDGKLKLEGQYSKNLKDGYFKFYEKGLLNKVFVWQAGALIFTFPKLPDEINRELSAISKLKTEFVGGWPMDFNPDRFTKTVEEDNIAGMTKLREYRYLCGLPYADLQINKEYVARNLDAVIVLKKLGGLNHFPKNPGVPEEVFKSGYIGTSSSNLALMAFNVTSALTVSMYMYDSDANNLPKLGHRRWCLSPNMKMTGFATELGYGAMWSINMGKSKSPPEYDYISYPARGFMPISHFHKSSAWSVSLNPNVYTTKSTDTIKVSISSFKDSIKEELKLSYQTINSEYIGTTNCVIFVPENISVTPKSNYHVLITGIKDKNNRDTKVEYFVEFY